jgi:hypothetical protein
MLVPSAYSGESRNLYTMFAQSSCPKRMPPGLGDLQLPMMFIRLTSALTDVVSIPFCPFQSIGAFAGATRGVPFVLSP